MAASIEHKVVFGLSTDADGKRLDRAAAERHLATSDDEQANG